MKICTTMVIRIQQESNSLMAWRSIIIMMMMADKILQVIMLVTVGKCHQCLGEYSKIPIMQDTAKSTTTRNQNSFSRRSHSDVLKLSRYDGTTSLNVFLDQFVTCAEYNNWDENSQLAHLKLSLDGGAAMLLYRGEGCNTVHGLIQRLRLHYGDGGQVSIYRVQLRNLRRKKDESLQDLCFTVERLIRLAIQE